MGEVIDVAAELAIDNPYASKIRINIYANALRTYQEAADNVRRNGAICSHPRTGSPMENPFLKILAQQSAIIGNMATINSDRVLQMLIDASKDKQLQANNAPSDKGEKK